MSDPRIFKMEVFFKIDGDLTTEEFKNKFQRKISDFTVYNEEGEEVEIDTHNYWETATVTEIV